MNCFFFIQKYSPKAVNDYYQNIYAIQYLPTFTSNCFQPKQNSYEQKWQWVFRYSHAHTRIYEIMSLPAIRRIVH